MKNKQVSNNNNKEKVVKNKATSNQLTAKQARKDLNVAIATKHESLGANFDIGHISKMSSLIKVSMDCILVLMTSKGVTIKLVSIAPTPADIIL